MEFACSPRSLVSSLSSNRGLIRMLISQEVLGLYRGSMLGTLWPVVHPILMLAVYTFIFSVVFQVRWSAAESSRGEFALILYAGLIVFNLFAECLVRSPDIVLEHTEFVKKMVFPLEILPAVVLGSALFHAGVSFLVWLCFYYLVLGLPGATIFLFPIVLLPLCFLSLGLSWLLSSVGVYLRDIGQVAGILSMALLFLSPIFYPMAALPEAYRWIFQLNPIAFSIAQARQVMVFGEMPDLVSLGILMTASAIFTWVGFVSFQRLRRGFSDVI